MNNPGEPEKNAIEQRLAALEQRLMQQSTQLEKHELDLSRLGLWQQGRLFGYIARLYPKNRSVIFLHSSIFGDNIKYAYLAFLKIAEKHGIACHFLINNETQRTLLESNGLPVLPAMKDWTLDHLRLLMSAKVVVACDHFTPLLWNPPLPYFLLQGARLVQLWHGIPFKEIGLLRSDTPGGTFENLHLSSTGPADLFVAPGSSMREQWREWFAFREFAPAGYPRNDALLRDAAGDELVNVDPFALNGLKAAREAGRKTIFYAPTFRDHIGSAWLDRADLAAFAAWCEAKGYFLFVKLHWIEQNGFDDLKRKMPDVRFARPDSDIYPLLRHADMLITDYSSIALDYLLLDRPIVFYWPDDEIYRAQCRNLLRGFEHYLVGDQATDAEALRRGVDEALSGGPGPWSGKRRDLARHLFDRRDGDSSDRVVRLILEQLDAPEQLPAGWGI